MSNIYFASPCLFICFHFVFSFFFSSSLIYLGRSSRFYERMVVSLASLDVFLLLGFSANFTSYVLIWSALLYRSCWIWRCFDCNPSIISWNKEASVIWPNFLLFIQCDALQLHFASIVCLKFIPFSVEDDMP